MRRAAGQSKSSNVFQSPDDFAKLHFMEQGCGTNAHPGPRQGHAVASEADLAKPVPYRSTPATAGSTRSTGASCPNRSGSAAPEGGASAAVVRMSVTYCTSATAAGGTRTSGAGAAGPASGSGACCRPTAPSLGESPHARGAVDTPPRPRSAEQRSGQSRRAVPAVSRPERRAGAREAPGRDVTSQAGVGGICSRDRTIDGVTKPATR